MTKLLGSQLLILLLSLGEHKEAILTHILLKSLNHKELGYESKD